MGATASVAVALESCGVAGLRTMRFGAAHAGPEPRAESEEPTITVIHDKLTLMPGRVAKVRVNSTPRASQPGPL